METPIGDESGRTIGDMLEAEECIDDHSSGDIELLVQSYINNNKIIEAILIDNIVSNDVQKHFKKTIKTQNYEGEPISYVEHSSEFWPYRLIQIVSKLPTTYKGEFIDRYDISEEKLTAVLDIIDRANNQKLYRYLDKLLTELRTSYAC
jgi:hypothetical protein